MPSNTTYEWNVEIKEMERRYRAMRQEESQVPIGLAESRLLAAHAQTSRGSGELFDGFDHVRKKKRKYSAEDDVRQTRPVMPAPSEDYWRPSHSPGIKRYIYSNDDGVLRLTKAALFVFNMLSTKESDGPREEIRKWLRTTGEWDKKGDSDVIEMDSDNVTPVKQRKLASKSNIAKNGKRRVRFYLLCLNKKF
ncbi:hypothetical protein AX14_010785 [Amanita brunnescens Koide BX004]|nr:hypothetical protein AX14_010785 [Amanita brunnescens Koide BX004]